MRKRVIAALLILSCTVMAFALPAIAAGTGAPEEPGGMSRLTLQYRNGSEPLSGVTFYLCKVGTYKSSGDGFTLDSAFAGAGVSLTGLDFSGAESGIANQTGESARKLIGYAKNTGGVKLSRTSSDGTAIFTELGPGLYLVWGDTMKIGRTAYTPQAFLIPLPYLQGDNFINTVTAKVKPEKKEGLTARKVWKDEKGEEVSPPPDASVTVQLYCNDELYNGKKGEGKQVLNAGNNWTYTWEDLDYTDPYTAWTVKEVEVKGEAGASYKVTMDWDVDTWTWIITNTKKGTGPGPGPTPTPGPTDNPDPTPTPGPTDNPGPTPTPGPTDNPGPTPTPGPTDNPEPSDPPGPDSDYDSITVTKIWKSVGSNPPTSLTVRLYCTDKDCTQPPQEATLDHDRNWSHTWKGLDTTSSHTWKVEEIVPDGYQASYGLPENNVWTITNTPSDSPEPTESPEPSESPRPSESPKPGGPGPDEPTLNTEDHFAYLIGYNDGTVRPNANITRAEVVTIFFRLLTDEMREKYWTTTNPYPDVERPAWYNNAISTMTNMGIIDGYPDGTFRPNAKITRAELTKIAVSFFNYADLHLTGDTKFTDVPRNKWYTRFIEAATELGLIQGYPDNTFRPEQAITRAETVTIINRVLGRKPHKDGLLEDMITWPDNMNVNAWYYADIQEATNSHDFHMGLYSSDGTWYYADDLHSENFQMGWSVSSGAWNWPEDMRGQDFLLCRHKSDGTWYYADIQDADRSHDFVICQHNSNGTWTWRYADDSPDNAVSGEYEMAPYDGTWTYPDGTDADAHDFLVCWHKSDGTWTWYYADDLREDQTTHDLQMVLYGTDGMYEHWTALLPVRNWAAFERAWSQLHPDVPNPGEVMDKALPTDNELNVRPEKKREEESEN